MGFQKAPPSAEKRSQFQRFVYENISSLIQNKTTMPPQFMSQEDTSSSDNSQSNNQNRNQNRQGKQEFSYIEASDVSAYTNPFACPLCSIHGEGTPCGNDVVSDWKACAELKTFFFGSEKGGEDVLDPEAVALAKKWRNHLLFERLSEHAKNDEERESIRKQVENYNDRFTKSDDFCHVFNERFFGCMTKWTRSNPTYYQKRASLMMHSFDFPVETAKLFLETKRYKRYVDQGMI